jgi:PAS domain S-box-containing protein
MPPNTERVPLVVYVDDDEDAHLLMRRAFTKSGVPAELQSISDGQQAIQFLATNTSPALLLLDLKMPKVSGFDVLESFQKNPPFPKFPVIVFSSSSQETDVTRAQSLGCTAYVVKPTEFQTLIDLVRAIDSEFLRPGQISPPPRSFSALAVPLKSAARENTPEIRSHKSPIDSPEIFRLLVEQVKDYAIFMLDKEGKILSWNEGARRIKGYEPQEVIGKHFSIFYPRQDIDSEKPNFELRMAIEMGRYEEEGWRVRKDGSRFWANVVITPLRNDDGDLQGFAKVTRDLTQRKLHEENFQRLLESEERFRLLVEQVKDYAIFILDAKGRISSWNQGARRIKGYSADEIIGKHFSIFYPPEDLAAEKPAMELTVAIRDGRYEEEGWRIKKDGSRFWASVVITALWDKRGNLTGFAKVTRDLSDRKKTEEALKHKTRELEAFAHTLSHDLRSPLRSISSFAQILRTEGADLAEQERAVYLDKIFNAARSMEQLINDLLKLTQVSAAEAPSEDVSLDKVLDETVALLEAEIKSSGAEIVVDRPLPILKANRTLILQIFSNLLANAVKFTAPGQRPRVEIFSQPINGSCALHVKDNGVGIAPQFRERIFNIFERGPAKGDQKGTGVGLAIVKRAVERLGGTIELKSHEGNGSEFIIKLACEPPAENFPKETPADIPDGQSLISA